MRTYDGFGHYYSNKRATFEISLPDYEYKFSFKNISNNGRNGIFISLIRTDVPDDGSELKNSELHFEPVDINLPAVEKETIAGEEPFDYDKPFFVFTFHDNDPRTYLSQAKMCYNDLKKINRKNKDKDILSPAKSGFGSLKKI